MRVKGNFEMFELYKNFYKTPSLVGSLRKYFEETPKEKLNKDLEEVKELNSIGPDVFEYEKFYKEMQKLRNLVSDRQENSKI
jgi:hypothetical protein